MNGLIIYFLFTKKLQDFNDWCILVYIYYYGYNKLSKSITIINEIVFSWNNFRLQNFTLSPTYSTNLTNLLLYHSNLGQKSTPTVSRVQINNPDS